MKQAIILLISTGMFTIACAPVSGQSNKSSKVDTSTGCLIPTPETLKKRGQLVEDQEIRYRSPVRYVIVYNDLGPTEDRRIDLLMRMENINEKDLRTVFCWVAERYPSPADMTIHVHTNLATVETPDERELLRDGNDSRFSKYFWMYKEADYHRYANGREAFGFTISVSPYRERDVVIREGK